MKNKFSLKRVIILSLILLFSYIYAQYNVRENSLYYAKHTPHSEEVDPEIMVLIKNRNWIYTPTPDGYSVYKIKDKFNYTHYSINEEKYERFYKFGSDEYLYCEKNKTKEINYYFKNKSIYTIEEYENDKFEKYNFSDKKPYDYKKEKEVYNKVRNLIKPILDANSEPPIINLQWLFDLKYKDYLN